jgi:hypothetical protein
MRKAFDRLLWGALGALLVFAIAYGSEHAQLSEAREEAGLCQAELGLAQREVGTCKTLVEVVTDELERERKQRECIEEPMIFCDMCEGAWLLGEPEQHEETCMTWHHERMDEFLRRVGQRESSRVKTHTTGSR